MLFKKCFKCLSELPLTDFYRHPRTGDGYLNKCKKCTKKDVSKHRAENIESIRKYDRERDKLPHRIEKNKEVTARWRERYPKRRLAQVMVCNAVRDGKLTPQPCFICGEKAEAHHPDYDQPLEVVWLCSSHHKQLHAMARKAA